MGVSKDLFKRIYLIVVVVLMFLYFTIETNIELGASVRGRRVFIMQTGSQ